MTYNPAYETAEFEQIVVFPKGKQGYYLLIKREGGVEQVPPETQNLDNLLKECTIVASQDILDQLGDDVIKWADMCPRFNIVDGNLVQIPRYVKEPLARTEYLP